MYCTLEGSIGVYVYSRTHRFLHVPLEGPHTSKSLVSLYTNQTRYILPCIPFKSTKDASWIFVCHTFQNKWCNAHTRYVYVYNNDGERSCIICEPEPHPPRPCSFRPASSRLPRTAPHPLVSCPDDAAYGGLWLAPCARKRVTQNVQLIAAS